MGRPITVATIGWRGAPDAVVAWAFLLGGLLAAGLVMADSAPAPFAAEVARWSAPALALIGFVRIAVRPVLEELIFRGALFSALATRVSNPTAVALSTLAWLVLCAPERLVDPAAALGGLVLGSGAALLRVRYRSLAPAMALRVGESYVTCIVWALG